MKHDSIQCVSTDSIVSLEFPESENISSSHWQIKFEEVFYGLTFPLNEITGDEYDTTQVNTYDVFIINPSLEHVSKAKRSAADSENPSSVDFVVLVYSKDKAKYLGVPKRLFCAVLTTRASTMDIPPAILTTEYARQRPTKWNIWIFHLAFHKKGRT
ncbi:hypothetical protein OS493_011058 [Desmophyllum pertusum]|uniref:Uncharacterized protein n=1 Tax=Desmophyllum pertusum TaxID=174260 RepID=A0A9W9ZFE9_9CNID|nr:hypothetical protein OS493_011058 [Desmophyllum pertusum]